MQNTLSGAASETATLIQNFVPSLLGAVAILIVGWFVAAYLSRLAQRGLEKRNSVHVSPRRSPTTIAPNPRRSNAGSPGACSGC